MYKQNMFEALFTECSIVCVCVGGLSPYMLIIIIIIFFFLILFLNERHTTLRHVMPFFQWLPGVGISSLVVSMLYNENLKPL